MNDYLNRLARNDNEKILIAKTIDLIQRAAYGKYGQTDFLDLRQQELVKAVSVNYSVDWQLNGGFAEAERKRLILYPEWVLEPETLIAYIRITHKEFKDNSIGHRDYLGAVLNLGIKREKLGDIIVQTTNAFLIADIEIASFISQQLLKVKHSNVVVEIIPKQQFVFEPPEIKSLQTTVASLRLDAIVAAAFNLPRADTNFMIEAGNVKINHLESSKCSVQIKTGDLISVRGWGRLRLEEIGNLSRKGRYHVTISRW
jgi:RNA-binding protein YlmH